MSTLLGTNPLEFVTEKSSLLDIDSVIISTESSYLSQTLKFIQECNNEFNEANRGWYKAILESGNDQVVITESFHNFFVKVKEIIDKFIAFIKSLAERFITNIMSIGKSDSYIKKHKDEFKKFKNSKDEFEFDGYEFTFNPTVPVCDIQANFTKEFIKFEISQNGEVLDANSAAATMKSIYDSLVSELENGWYDEFRKTVLAISYDVSQSDFANECFSVFRNGTSDKDSITVNANYVDSAYNRFTNYSDMKKDVESIQKRITKEYEAVKKQILEISKTSYTGKVSSTDINLPNNQMSAVKLNTDTIKYLDLYIKAKTDQIQEMSNIHAIAFSSKLDALKASYVQDKTILYKALSRCQRVHTEANYTDYTKQFEYASFLLETLENQNRMEKYIQECCILSEGVNVVERIRILNEGKIGDNFRKFIDWIKGIIAKFTEKLTALAAKDTTYLEKYKDIILGKKFDAKDEFNMPDYFVGMTRIGKYGVPQFNYVSQEALLAGENGEFAKSIINEYDPSKHDSFSAFCKEFFQGGSDDNPKTFSGTEFGAHIKDVYDFCYDFKKIQNQINNDQNELLKAAKKAEDKLVEASKNNEANRQTTAQSSDANSQDNNGQQTVQNNNAVYSNVYGTYITEEDNKPLIKKPEPAQNNNTTNNNTKLSGNINNISDKGKEVNNNSDDAKAKAGEQEISQITNNVKRYNDVCGSLLTAKLTVIEKMRSDFMKIIRYHVEKYVGKTDDKGDNRGATATGSDYRIPKEAEDEINKNAEVLNNGSDKEKATIINGIAKKFNTTVDSVKKWISYKLKKS